MTRGVRKSSGWRGVILAVVLVQASSAWADTDCSSTLAKSNGWDPNDTVYYTTSGTLPCFSFSGSGVSDFNGARVECRRAEGCGTAIEIGTIDAAYTIREVVIGAGFSRGIDGSGATANYRTEAIANAITASPGATAIYGVDQVLNNVVRGEFTLADPEPLIYWAPTVSPPTGQAVDENYIEGWVQTGIEISSTATTGTAWSVGKNVVKTYGHMIRQVGSASGKADLHDNLLIRAIYTDKANVVLLTGSAITYSGNICNVLGEDADSLGVCSEPTRPFDLSDY